MTIKNTPERLAECRALEADYLNHLWPSDGAEGKREDARHFAIADTICEIKESLVEHELAEHGDATGLAEAAVILTRRLGRVFSAEERMQADVRSDPMGYLRYIADLTRRAVRAGYISPVDFELMEGVEVIERNLT